MVTTVTASLRFFFRGSIEVNRLVRCIHAHEFLWKPSGDAPILSVAQYSAAIPITNMITIQRATFRLSQCKYLISNPNINTQTTPKWYFVSIPILVVFAPWNLIPPSLVVCYFARTFWANMGLEPQQESIAVLVQLLSPTITMYVLRQSIRLMFQSHIVDTPNSINNILILPQIKIPA